MFNYFFLHKLSCCASFQREVNRAAGSSLQQARRGVFVDIWRRCAAPQRTHTSGPAPCCGQAWRYCWPPNTATGGTHTRKCWGNVWYVYRRGRSREGGASGAPRPSVSHLPQLASHARRRHPRPRRPQLSVTVCATPRRA